MLEQTRSFATEVDAQGFAIVEDVFDAREIESVLVAVGCEPLARSRAGARHAMQIPAIAAFARDTRLLQRARAVLGPAAVPFRATFFDKSPTSNWLVAWHQDTALPLTHRAEVVGWGPWSLKAGVLYAHAPPRALEQVLALRIHFDDSTATNGPLRVLPSTHGCGVLTDDAVGALARASQSRDCLVGRGGVLAMRPLLIHASSKSRDSAPRRVLHIEYAASMQIGDGFELAIA